MVDVEEKGGKFHEVPAHHKAEEYLDAAGMGNKKGAPLWRSMSRERTFSENRMSRVDVFRMIKRRVRQAELGAAANCHTFRATGITAYCSMADALRARRRSPRTNRHGPPSSTTGQPMRSRLMKSSGSSFEGGGNSPSVGGTTEP